MTESKSVALPLGYTPFCINQYTIFRRFCQVQTGRMLDIGAEIWYDRFITIPQEREESQTRDDRKQKGCGSMNLCAGQYRYLLCIYRLQRERGRIRCVDIANDLGVTRPSVSKMIKCMLRMELVEPDYCEAVRLTPLGISMAEKLNDDYDMTYAFFRRILRLTPAEAKEHAFLFLSDFPDTTVKKLAGITGRSLEVARKKRLAESGDK